PAGLHVAVPSCAKGFTTVTVGGESYGASLKSGALVLAGAGENGSVPPPAIPAGAAVDFDTSDPVGPSKTYTVGGSRHSDALSGLSASSFYTVSVAAINRAGIGVAVLSQGEISPALEVGNRTTILNQTALNDIAMKIDNGTTEELIWHTPPSQAAGIQSGDCVVVGKTVAHAPGRLLLVQWAGFNHVGDYVIVGTSAGLDDAYRSISYSVAGTPPGMGGTVSAASAHHHTLKHYTINVNKTWGPRSVAGTV